MIKPDVSRLDLDTLKGKIILANVPSYLYRHFRADASVQFLAESPTESLIKFFNSLVKKKDKSFDTIAVCYAIIVALTFKEYSQVRYFFDKLETYDLEWLPEIKAIYLSSVRITESSQYTIPSIRPIEPQFQISSGNSFTKEEVKPVILIERV